MRHSTPLQTYKLDDWGYSVAHGKVTVVHKKTGKEITSDIDLSEDGEADTMVTVHRLVKELESQIS